MTRPKKLTFLLLLTCALALVLAACGGDDSNQSGGETTPTLSDPSPAPEPDPAPAPPSDPPAEPSGGAPDPPATPPEPPAPPPSELTAPGEVAVPTSVPAGSIAIVGERSISQGEFDVVLGQRRDSIVNQGGEFPAVGSVEYETIKNQLVEFLIQRAQFLSEADALDIEVTDDEVNARLDNLKEQFFEGDEERYEEELTNQGLTEEQVLKDIRFQELTDKLFASLTAELEVSDEDIAAYYADNLEAFTQSEQREVAHILVETKEEADAFKAMIDEGEDFAKLAEDNSIDSGTAVNGGAYTAVKGLSVAEFDEAAYALETGAVSDPVETQFGWHIIKALEDIEPESIQTLEDIRENVVGLVRNELESSTVDQWLRGLAIKYKGKILFAPGFELPLAEEPVDEGAPPPAEESAP